MLLPGSYSRKTVRCKLVNSCLIHNKLFDPFNSVRSFGCSIQEPQPRQRLAEYMYTHIQKPNGRWRLSSPGQAPSTLHPAVFTQAVPSSLQLHTRWCMSQLHFLSKSPRAFVGGIGNLFFRQTNTRYYEAMCLEDVWGFVDGSDWKDSKLFLTRLKHGLFGDSRR